MEAFVVRLWLPDRPGVLGAVASRIGAVKGDVIGIDILETGNGAAVDELVVTLPEGSRIDLLVNEMQEVDGVKVEDVRPIAGAVHDPRLDALETAAQLVGADDPAELDEGLCVHAARTVGASWAVLLDPERAEVRAAVGQAPSSDWLAVFVVGSRSAAQLSGHSADGSDPTEAGADDVIWAPLCANSLAIVAGRVEGPKFRARERRQLAALARIVDTRRREVVRRVSRAAHPSTRSG
jgi:hypothetical protein